MTSPRSAASAVCTNVDTLSSMPREPKKPRSVRATDEVWNNASAESKRRGEYLSEAIDRFLVAYAEGGDVTKGKSRR